MGFYIKNYEFNIVCNIFNFLGQVFIVLDFIFKNKFSQTKVFRIFIVWIIFINYIFSFCFSRFDLNSLQIAISFFSLIITNFFEFLF